MKKYFTGMICVAAMLAASVVLLPAAAVMIAVRLSKPREHSGKDSPHAEDAPSKEFLPEPDEMEARLT